jgi:UPF0755 protein
MTTKTKTFITLLFLFTMALTGYFAYQKVFSSNITKKGILYIKTDTEFGKMMQELKPFLKNEATFKLLAQKMKFSKPKAGRYEIKKGMNNVDLIRKLRAGMQDPVKVSFNNQDYLERLAGRLAQQFEADSLAFLTALTDEKFLTENGFDKENVLSMYIPNSYEFYWTTTPEKFRERMLKEYKQFWNENRIAKAKKQNLTPAQVSTLASIVQKETANVSERKTVAGLYLNRLNDKILLQADPTVIYSVKQTKGQDYEMKRVLFKDLEIDSKYNTYKYEGLPPGPIAMPDISSIEAVLNPENHEYYFMCASVSDFGKHVFAKTLAQHNVNAAKYQKWVAEQEY